MSFHKIDFFFFLYFSNLERVRNIPLKEIHEILISRDAQKRQHSCAPFPNVVVATGWHDILKNNWSINLKLLSKFLKNFHFKKFFQLAASRPILIFIFWLNDKSTKIIFTVRN